MADVDHPVADSYVQALFDRHRFVKTSVKGDEKNRKNTELIHDKGLCRDDRGDSFTREKNRMIIRFKKESSNR
jgi:hypothetical protein